MNKIFKMLLSALIMIFLPFTSVILFGAVYIIIQMTIGIAPLTALNSFKVLVYSLIPYFTYLTIIPIGLTVVALLLKMRIKIKK